MLIIMFLLEVVDSADVKSDLIQKNFDSIWFTGNDVMARGQKKEGVVACLKFSAVENLS